LNTPIPYRKSLSPGTDTPAATSHPLFPVTAGEWDSWQWQVENTVYTACQLAQLTGLDERTADSVGVVAERFPVRITPYYLSLVRELSSRDPVFAQVCPDLQEISQSRLEIDGLGEERFSPVPGVIHKYPDRILIIATAECAVLCRHCFRKRLWGQACPAPSRFEPALDYIRSQPQACEVILSGGDALLLPEGELLALIESLAAIPHISVVRVASRLPVVLPQRLSPGFCSRLASAGPVWFMTQFNHPREVTGESVAACRSLVSNGVPVMNQTVLLKGVNDDSNVLSLLFRALVGIGVKPYYLFHGDPIAGTEHFRTGIDCGIRIMAELQQDLSGLALPKFVLDLPEGGGKISLEPNHTVSVSETAGFRFRALDGREIEYH